MNYNPIMRIIVFDTETNGLQKGGNKSRQRHET